MNTPTTRSWFAGRNSILIPAGPAVFPYEQVKQGILDIAAKFFRVSFRQESDAQAWAPGVETWDVLDQGEMIGRFYLDMHPRAGKFPLGRAAPVLDGAVNMFRGLMNAAF